MAKCNALTGSGVKGLKTHFILVYARAGLTTRLTRLQPRAPTAASGPNFRVPKREFCLTTFTAITDSVRQLLII